MDFNLDNLSPHKQILFHSACQQIDKASHQQAILIAKSYAYHILIHQQTTQDLSKHAWFEHLESAVTNQQAIKPVPWSYQEVQTAALRHYITYGLSQKDKEFIQWYADYNQGYYLSNFRPSVCTTPADPNPAYRVLCNPYSMQTHTLKGGTIILETTYKIDMTD